MTYIRYLQLIIVLALTSCTYVPPPKNLNNACSIALQYQDWYYESLNVYKTWGVPINVQWAFILKESRFIANAQTSMQYLFGFIPIGRKSTAYGYAQALNGTWDEYKKYTGKSHSDRTNFSDAVDFIGWYADRAQRIAGIKKNDTYHLYLAYHQGIHGYMKGSYKNKERLLKYAHETEIVANRYAHQLYNCPIPEKK